MHALEEGDPLKTHGILWKFEEIYGIAKFYKDHKSMRPGEDHADLRSRIWRSDIRA